MPVISHTELERSEQKEVVDWRDIHLSVCYKIIEICHGFLSGYTKAFIITIENKKTGSTFNVSIEPLS